MIRLGSNALAFLGSALLVVFVGPWLYKHLLALIIFAFYYRASDFSVPIGAILLCYLAYVEYNCLVDVHTSSGDPPFTLYVMSVIAFLTAFGLRSIISKKFTESWGRVTFRICCTPLFTYALCFCCAKSFQPHLMLSVGFLILRNSIGLANLSNMSQHLINYFGIIFTPIFVVILIWWERYRADTLTFVELSNLISLQSVFCHNLFRTGPSSKKTDLPYRLSILAFGMTSIVFLALRTNVFNYFSRNVVLTSFALLEIVLFLFFGSALASMPTEDNLLSCTTAGLVSGLVITLILGWHQLSNRLGSILLKPSRLLWLMVLSIISCLATLGALSLLHAKRETYFGLAVGLLCICTHFTDVILYYALISPPGVSLCHSGVAVLLAYTLQHRLGRAANVKLITTFGLLVPALSKALFVCLDVLITASPASPWPDQLHTATTTSSNSHSAVSLAQLLLLSSPRRVPHVPEVVGCLMLFAGLLGALRVFLCVASSTTTGPLPASVRRSPEARVWVGLVLIFLWFYLATRLFLLGVIRMVWMLIFDRPLDIPSPIFALLLTVIALYRPTMTNLPASSPTAIIADSCDGAVGGGHGIYSEANLWWHELGPKVDLNLGYLITCLRLLCLVCALPLVTHFTVSVTSFNTLLLLSYLLIPVCAYLTLSLPLRVTAALWTRSSFAVNLTRPSIVLRVMTVSFTSFLFLKPFFVVDLFSSPLIVCFTGSLIGIYYGSASASNLPFRPGVGEGERTMHLKDIASLILCYACLAQSSALLLLALASSQLKSPVMWCIGLGSIFFISQYAYWLSSRASSTKRHQSKYFDWRIVLYVNISVSLTFLALCFNSLSHFDQPQISFIPLVLTGLCGRRLEGSQRIVPALLAFTFLSFTTAFLQLFLFTLFFNWRSFFELFLLLALLPLYASLVLNRLQLNLCKRKPKIRLAVGFRRFCDVSSFILMPLCIFCPFLTSSLTSAVYQGAGIMLCFAHIQGGGLDI